MPKLNPQTERRFPFPLETGGQTPARLAIALDLGMIDVDGVSSGGANEGVALARQATSTL